MIPKHSEIWLADLGLAAKRRPVLILSRKDDEAPRALVIYIPLTTQNRGSRYEIVLGKLPFLSEISIANVQGIGSAPISRFEKKLGMLSVEQMAAVKKAVAFALDME